MTATFRVIFHFVTVALIFHCGVDGVIFKITRGVVDTFTNINDCHKMNATEHCVHNINCPYCKCGVNETFERRRGQYGKCINDHRLATCKCMTYFILKVP